MAKVLLSKSQNQLISSQRAACSRIQFLEMVCFDCRKG